MRNVDLVLVQLLATYLLPIAKPFSLSEQFGNVWKVESVKLNRSYLLSSFTIMLSMNIIRRLNTVSNVYLDIYIYI